MAFCVGVMSLTTVSCTKEIEQDIADLKEQVADIQKKLADLEAKLTNDVKTLNDLIAAANTAATTADAALKAELEAKIAVIGFEENADGTITLTFGNGSKVVVSAPVELDPNANNTGLVSTVEVDGKLYWATVNADGTKTSLGVEVGHPTDTIDFKVDETTKELLVSINNGQFEGTGVIIKDPDTYDHTIVTAVENDDNTVTITIGEASYVLPKYEDLGSVVLDRTEVFVNYSTTKSITLNTENVSELYVMNQPTGWQATIEGSTLTVTAPSKEVAEFGACATKGQILLHATNAAGKCTVAKLDVTTGPATGLSIDAEGNLTVFNALTSTTVNWGEVMVNFVPTKIGIIPASEFLAYESPEAFFKAAATSELLAASYFENIASNYDNNIITWYVEGENEELSLTLPLEVVADGMYPSVELDENETYVIWTLPVSDTPHYDEALYVFNKPYISVKASNEVYNNVDLDIEVYGADSYYVGIANKSSMELSGLTLEMYLEYGPYYMGGPWMDFQNGDVNGMGAEINNGKTDSKLADYADEYDPIKASTEYYVWVFPYFKDKAAADYTIADDVMPYVFTCKTGDMTLNESLVATVTDIAVTPFSYSFTLTAPEDGATYYYLCNEETYSSMTEEDFMIEFEYSMPLEGFYEYVEDYGVKPNSKYYLVTYSTKGGEKGLIKTFEFETPALNYSSSINVAFQTLTEDTENNTYTATFKVTGAEYFAGYNQTYAGPDSWSPSVEAMEKYIVTQNSYVTTVEVPEDGVVTFTFPKNAYKKHLHATAYNAADGVVSEIAAIPVVVELATGNLVEIE